MADVTIELLRTHFRQLRLPTMGQEFERLGCDAAATNQTFVQFLLGLTEIELETRAANAVATRIKNAEFPVLKDFDTYDFSVLPQLSKPKVLELSRCEWIEHKHNCCLVGSHGTGKTQSPWPWARRRVVRVCGCSSSRRRSWSASWRRRKSSTPWTDSWANWSERSS